MSDIDFNDIRRLDGGLLLVFRELMRQRRTTAVAARLGLSQSAISHALSRLRDLFGDPLFVRKPHGLEPTQRAFALAPRIEALIALAAETVGREQHFDPAQTTRRFRISAPEFVAAQMGADLVTAFHKAAPRATFAVVPLTQDQAFTALRRGETDLALGRFGQEASGIVVERLYDDRYCVVARRGHPGIKGRIGYETWLKTGHVFATALSEVREEPANAPDPAGLVATAYVPRWLTVLAMVAASDAIATCPLRLARKQAEVLKLQVILAPFLKNRISVSAAWREDKETAAREGTLWLLKQVRRSVR
jgi:DNA-binding transcriptional LysR family regulator